MKKYQGIKIPNSEYEFIHELNKILGEEIPLTEEDDEDEFNEDKFGAIANKYHVIKLILKFKNLKKLPESIKKLERLEELYLRGNQLKNLPESIGTLEELEILQLDENEIISLPNSIGNLESLEQLYLNRNKLIYIPDTIGHLQRLEILQLDSNKLTNLPESIGELKWLEHLNLFRNKLSFLPESIGNLKRLEYLQLEGNCLNSLPTTIGKLNSLETLFLDGNNLQHLPDSIGRLEELDLIQLDENKLKKLPNSIGRLRILKQLYLKNNKLTTLPDSLDLLEELEIIQINGNNITNLSASLNSLIDGNNKIIYQNDQDLFKHSAPNRLFEPELSIYDQIELYKSELDVINELNNLLDENIPITKDSERNLFGLYAEGGRVINLILDNKNLKLLPDSLGNLKDLKQLSLKWNYLKNLPGSIGQLKTLESLNLSCNQFKIIPGSIWPLKELTDLNLDNNPLTQHEQDILDNSISMVLDYCRKKSSIQIFISHAIADKDKYRIEELAKNLENQREIYKVFICEKYLIGNIDEFMEDYIPKCQILLFIATNHSVNLSPDCKKEIEIALHNDIEIIPLKSDEISWEDLQNLKIDREYGIEFDVRNFEIFCNDLYDHIKKYKREINLFEKEETIVDKEILNIKNVILKTIDSEEFKNYLMSNIDKIVKQNRDMGNEIHDRIKFLINIFKPVDKPRSKNFLENREE